MEKDQKTSCGFRELKVWQKSKKLAVDIYLVTKDASLNHDFGLRDQMRRAAVSIPSNIAEGDERGSNRESVRFLYIAKGSLAELQTQLEIAHEIGYIDQKTLKDIGIECLTIGKMLGSLIKTRMQSKG
ncbi:MAG TPA: four helix bundle protein [Desulfobacteraceae bacterium]|jgi:four helix bundle protein|nr:four helix bundle protein [Desulfobacteraceae bacterium]HPJ68590.1 four helix bundle protein [Desulfobacteraceae bacterium]HPQ27409.1 four helix bundle protein [Desulfobacteraceae bacterium]